MKTRPGLEFLATVPEGYEARFLTSLDAKEVIVIAKATEFSWEKPLLKFDFATRIWKPTWGIIDELTGRFTQPDFHQEYQCEFIPPTEPPSPTPTSPPQI